MFLQKISRLLLCKWRRKLLLHLSFKVKYNWIKIEKTSNTLRIEKIDKSMKESLKECIKCDPTLDQFWLYHFKVAWRERDGTTHQAFLYEFDEFFF